jgi:uncharacterized repeat protein (TIGR03803 family)
MRAGFVLPQSAIPDFNRGEKDHATNNVGSAGATLTIDALGKPGARPIIPRGLWDQTSMVEDGLRLSFGLCGSGASFSGTDLHHSGKLRWARFLSSCLWFKVPTAIYGTTTDGGARNYGAGFKISPSGTLAVLYNFCVHTNCTDGAYPIAGLVLGTDENFYGTTALGGAYDDGTVFRMTRGGVLTVLHSFNGADGANPQGALIQATDGNFYGTTGSGGAINAGTVFRITGGGKLTTLSSFVGAEGGEPLTALVQGADGNFYGTTLLGGIGYFGCHSASCGTVFKITPAGTLTTLHSFDFTDGANPEAPLIEGKDGSFYGTTFQGGTDVTGCFSSGCGTVFKITRAGALTTLHFFNDDDGAFPAGAVVQATDGDLYGTTTEGGANGPGTIFRIAPGGALTTLYTFCPLGDCADGEYPYGGLLQATNGTLYGTAAEGGAYADGTIFSENVGLGPFVITVPTARKVGQSVIIRGTNLTGTTSVTFNGTAATFKVVSATEFTTTVPSGATTGTVQVVTPGETLKSNVPFRVLP